VYLNKLKWGLISYVVLSLVIIPVGAVANAVPREIGRLVVLSGIAFSIVVGYGLIYEREFW
jgi:hypothetical protein